MIRFWHGTKAQYDAIAKKDTNTLYFITDQGGIYKGSILIAELSGAAIDDILDLIGDMNTVTRYTDIASALKALIDAVAKINGDDDATSVNKKVAAAKAELTGTAADDKTALTLYGMIARIQDALTKSAVTVEKNADGNYSVKQNGTEVGKITIPKDMVVSAGSVQTNPDAEHTGTFIVLTIANAAQDKLYIDVAGLIENYTAAANATQVQIAIDASTRVVSATIVAKSITSTELADKAVTADKLADDVAGSLFWQTAEVVEGV